MLIDKIMLMKETKHIISNKPIRLLNAVNPRPTT
jgi:hypothetical protein